MIIVLMSKDQNLKKSNVEASIQLYSIYGPDQLNKTKKIRLKADMIMVLEGNILNSILI